MLPWKLLKANERKASKWNEQFMEIFGCLQLRSAEQFVAFLEMHMRFIHESFFCFSKLRSFFKEFNNFQLTHSLKLISS